jgi:ubiquinol-cytochrome c reductase cytochrome b subunit
MRLFDWLDERTGYRRSMEDVLDRPLAGGASFAHAIGSVVIFFLALQAITGALLAFYYSPSSTDAWASVAYVEDQVSMGWLVRGVHHHGASALVLAIGTYLLVAITRGSYYAPREGMWWTGVVMLFLVMAFALTGDLLPFDQNGFWATRIRLGYAAASPGGADVVSGIQGGNDFGNLTLTRFHALHVVVLPAVGVAVVAIHLALQRRLGVTPRWGRSDDELARATGPYWPAQAFRDALVVTLAFGALVAWTVHTHGAGLTAPADPSAAYDARPSWFERPLFQLVRMMPASMEATVATIAPVMLLFGLFFVPFVDRGHDRSLRRRAWVLALVAVSLVGIGALTVMSFRADDRDATFQKNQVVAREAAKTGRRLARTNGVPAAGGTAVYTTAPFYRARALWTEHCDGCHQGDDRKGPVIGPGYNNRAWIRGMLTKPSDDAYYGRTKLGKSDDAMPEAEATGADLDALIEMVYAESGAPDADKKLAARGIEVFSEQPCGDCHEREGDASSSGPNLAGRGSIAHLTTFIGDTGQARFFGEKHQMTRFADDLGPEDRERLAEWLVWLRTATADDIKRLDQ